MKSIIVAPVGTNIDALFVGVREFPTEKIVLIAHEKYKDEARRAEKDLKKFRVPVSVVDISGDIWEETFRAIAEIKKTAAKNIIVNVGAADVMTQCAATSAAFVNGLKAFSVVDSDIMLLPVLKFSYYKLIPKRKMEIIQCLSNEKDCCASFEELSKKLRMSLPLLSYHINGSRKSEGLRSMELVETAEKRGKIEIRLSTLGRLIVKGYVT